MENDVKNFGMTRTLPRANKMSSLGEMALVRDVTENQMVTTAELQRSCVNMGVKLNSAFIAGIINLIKWLFHSYTK